MKKLIISLSLLFLLVQPIYASEVRGNLTGVILSRQQIQNEINRITILIAELRLQLKVDYKI